jgi:hypothetical protein
MASVSMVTCRQVPDGSLYVNGSRRADMLVLAAMATDDETPLTDYSPDGVDLTLIRWMLSLTPAERLEFLEERVNEIISIRELNARA